MSEQRDASMLRVASANLEYGGLSGEGDATRLGKTIDALRAWDPDVVLLQEMTARAEPGLLRPLRGIPADERDGLLREMTSRAEAKTREHMRGMARELGMTPVLGPPTPMAFGLIHPAIMVRAGQGVQILHTGPPSSAAGSVAPAWSQARRGRHADARGHAKRGCLPVPLPARAGRADRGRPACRTGSPGRSASRGDLVSASILVWAAAGLVLVACGAMAALLVGGQHEHERLYGQSPGWPRIHRPVRRRVPGLPRDGVLTGQQEAAIGEMGRRLRKDGRP